MSRKPPDRRAQAPQIRQRASPAKTWRKKTPADKPPRPTSSAKKVAAYRERQRKRGMRLLHIWVPNTHTPEFIAQAHAESASIANSPSEADDQAFVDSVSWWNSPEAAVLSQTEGSEPWWRTRETSD